MSNTRQTYDFNSSLYSSRIEVFSYIQQFFFILDEWCSVLYDCFVLCIRGAPLRGDDAAVVVSLIFCLT
jgi:hypothetical protein